MPALLLLLIAYSAALAADDDLRWYQVEVVIFDRPDLEVGLASEHWPVDPGWPKLAQGVELDPLGEQTAPGAPRYPALDLTLAELNDAVDRLQGKGYRVLAHRLWVQPTLAGERPHPALITDPDAPDRYQPLRYLPEYQPEPRPFPDQEAFQAAEAETAPAAAPETAEPLAAPEVLPSDTVLELEGGAIGTLPLVDPQLGQPVEPEALAEGGDALLVSHLGPPQKRLFGTIRLRRSRYLHLELDLLYRPEPERLAAAWPQPPLTSAETETAPEAPTSPAAPAEADLAEEEEAAAADQLDPWSVNGFRLHQKRRIRSRELHYFDHPLFGVLAQVRPVDGPPRPASDEADADEAAVQAFPGGGGR